MAPIDLCCVDRLDRAVGYGESCFETFVVEEGVPRAWSAHFARLRRGCDRLGIVLDDRDETRLRDAIAGLPAGERVARLTVSPGEAAMGLATAGDGPRAWLQSTPRVPRPPARLRSMPHPRGDAPVVAKFGCDYGLMLRSGGRGILARGELPLLWHGERLCGAAIANVALWCDGVWWTPAVGDGGVLPGITRQRLIDAGLLREGRCDRALVARAEAVVLLNSVLPVQPPAAIDGRSCRDHPAVDRLRAALEP